MKVLVVDDLAVNRKLFRVMLATAGHEGVEAADGVEALAKLRGGGFDAVISDVLMPRMDGYHLCSEIRRSEELQALPIIICSSTHLSDSDSSLALNAGADTFFRKPVAADVILDTLTELTSNVRPRVAAPQEELDTLKEYSEKLVHMLEERNRELEAARQQLAATNEALQESEASFRGVFLANPVATCLSEIESGRFLDFNESMMQLLGYEREDLLGRTSVELGIWTDAAEREQLVASVAGSPSIRNQVLYLRRKTGELIQVLASFELFRFGRETVLLSVLHDITESRRTVEALRESEERYRSLFDLMPLPMLLFDPVSFAVLAVNIAAVEHYGYSHDEFLALTLGDIQPLEDEPVPEAVDWTVGERGNVGLRQHRRRDGSVIDVEIYTHRIALEGKQLRISVVRDVTEQRQLEEQFRQAQKMEAIGRLTSGIAHDFNNLLTPILGYSEDLARQIGESHALYPEIAEIRKAGERAAALTRRLLAFSRQQVLSPKVLDLNSIVKEMETLLRRVLGEDLELAAVLEPGLGRIKADPGQIEQVLMNLAVNARDAMPMGGRLTIETRNVELDEDFASEHLDVGPGPHVMLSVTDTGTGMDAETKSRIFEPFFTTKEPGKGTGLGLSTIYGIVKQSGGTIWLYSELGLGSTFKIYLPRVEGTVERPAPEAETSLGGHETVLVAEDDEAVRLLTRFALERYGYTVLATSGGAEALQVATHHLGPIHVLLTDMLMAGMTGIDLAAKIGDVLPGTKVVFMSGYSENARAWSGDLPGKAVLLEKPFTAETLARKLRQVLSP